MLQALIVGAGPVGLTLAAELARYGIGIRLIDKSPQPTQTSKALVVWPRTLELMDRMGCRQAFLDAGLRVHGAALRSAGSILGHIRFDAVASTYNFALMIPQRETERLLIEHLATFGVAVEREVELVSFVTADEHVEATLRHADGAEETISASWLIGCRRRAQHRAARARSRLRGRGAGGRLAPRRYPRGGRRCTARR